MTNTWRTVCAANQQSTPHDGVITISSHEANLPPQGSNAQLHGNLPPQPNANPQGSDLSPTWDNPTQGTTVPPIQETEYSLPLTSIPTGLLLLLSRAYKMLYLHSCNSLIESLRILLNSTYKGMGRIFPHQRFSRRGSIIHLLYLLILHRGEKTMISHHTAMG